MTFTDDELALIFEGKAMKLREGEKSREELRDDLYGLLRDMEGVIAREGQAGSQGRVSFGRKLANTEGKGLWIPVEDPWPATEIEEATFRDLARLGVKMGDAGGLAFIPCLRAFANSPFEHGSESHTEFIGGQVYANVENADVKDVAQFVEIFRELFPVDKPDTLLAREGEYQNAYVHQMDTVENEAEERDDE